LSRVQHVDLVPDVVDWPVSEPVQAVQFALRLVTQIFECLEIAIAIGSGYPEVLPVGVKLALFDVDSPLLQFQFPVSSVENQFRFRGLATRGPDIVLMFPQRPEYFFFKYSLLVPQVFKFRFTRLDFIHPDVVHLLLKWGQFSIFECSDFTSVRYCVPGTLGCKHFAS
jgi:hypothetical protein